MFTTISKLLGQIGWRRAATMLLLSSFLVIAFGAVAAAQQEEPLTPNFSHVFLNKQWVGIEGLPGNLQNFQIVAASNWIDSNGQSQSSQATCSYVNTTLVCDYTTTVVYNGESLNGTGLVVELYGDREQFAGRLAVTGRRRPIHRRLWRVL